MAATSNTLIFPRQKSFRFKLQVDVTSLSVFACAREHTHTHVNTLSHTWTHTHTASRTTGFKYNFTKLQISGGHQVQTSSNSSTSSAANVRADNTDKTQRERRVNRAQEVGKTCKHETSVKISRLLSQSLPFNIYICFLFSFTRLAVTNSSLLLLSLTTEVKGSSFTGWKMGTETWKRSIWFYNSTNNDNLCLLVCLKSTSGDISQYISVGNNKPSTVGDEAPWCTRARA